MDAEQSGVTTSKGTVAPFAGGGSVDGSGLSAEELNELLQAGYRVVSTSGAGGAARELGPADVTMSDAEYFATYGCRRQPAALTQQDLPLSARVRVRHRRLTQADVTHVRDSKEW
jgi:hypothetical protein